MLTQRLTAKFKVVSIYDEATLDISDSIIAEYQQSRDFSIIEEHLSKSSEKATIFHCLPLQADKEYLADSLLSAPADTAWTIFKHHVKGADNFLQKNGEPIIEIDDETEIIKAECRKRIPKDIIQEIAGVILHKANESTKPFMTPDTWLRTRIRSRTRRVQRAEKETANEPDTK